MSFSRVAWRTQFLKNQEIDQIAAGLQFAHSHSPHLTFVFSFSSCRIQIGEIGLVIFAPRIICMDGQFVQHYIPVYGLKIKHNLTIIRPEYQALRCFS